jgi:hypothetical protein
MKALASVFQFGAQHFAHFGFSRNLFGSISQITNLNLKMDNSALENIHFLNQEKLAE